jgi:hypothetical protein
MVVVTETGWVVTTYSLTDGERDGVRDGFLRLAMYA